MTLFWEGPSRRAITWVPTGRRRDRGRIRVAQREAGLSWKGGDQPLAYTQGEIDIWRVEMAAAWSKRLDVSTLAREEFERAMGFKSALDRCRYLVTHVALREILTRYLGGSAGELRFSVGRSGKPEVEASSIAFSASHSGGFTLIAVGREEELGVDIELVRGFPDVLRVARHVLPPWEAKGLRSMGRDERILAFFRCWTRREAYVKARGYGLAREPDDREVAGPPQKDSRRSADEGMAQIKSAEWTIVNLAVGIGYAAALAVHGPVRVLRLVDWSGSKGYKEQSRQGAACGRD